MNVQEQEELDFNPQSDFQNAYALSRMRFEPVDQRTANALAAGLFVVTVSYLAYCPITDASLGEGQMFRSSHADRAAAEQAAADLADEENEESTVRVLPEVAAPVVADYAPGDDEIPF